jgi:hypothetical protein
MYIQKYKYLFLYMQSENMYRTCLYHVYTWIYQPKQVHTCYKQPKARYLQVLHPIKKKYNYRTGTKHIVHTSELP